MTGEGRHPERIPMREWAASIPVSARGNPAKSLRPEVPVTFWAYLPGRGYTQLHGHATAFTDRAGHVVYSDEHGRQGSVWVWASAITRR